MTDLESAARAFAEGSTGSVWVSELVRVDPGGKTEHDFTVNDGSIVSGGATLREAMDAAIAKRTNLHAEQRKRLEWEAAKLRMRLVPIEEEGEFTEFSAVGSEA